LQPSDLGLLIQARNPIIAIQTPDEPRAIKIVREFAEQLKLPFYEWSIIDGLRQTCPPTGGKPIVEPNKVIPALGHLRQTTMPALYLFKDLGAHCKDAQVVRLLRELYYSPDSRLWTLVMVDGASLPPEVKRLTVPFEVGWPNEDELSDLVRETYRHIKRESLVEVQSKLTKREMEQLVQTLRGLTTEEARRIVAGAIHEDNILDSADLTRVIEAKRNRLGTMGCLEAIAVDVSPDDIGGLKNLKQWLNLRRGGFSARARDFGLDPPRGILLLGVQGCGKSLCAKVVASAWRMPLLRMDPGVLYQKFIGESEARLREALTQAESMSPVILWIDEIEKAFASAGAESADGGLSQRMFGTLLSWMQDHRQPIFLMATANNIGQLPPELMRKGRFDEIFFVDLPEKEDRESIFAIHLRRRRRDKHEFDLSALVEASEGYSGAEIEQAVVSGMYAAFADGAECNTDHVLAAIRASQPLSVVLRERVETLRAWAKGRCVPAD
jgi:SpoVK/Ycf46/Vps4 family AAA+-type ATPase